MSKVPSRIYHIISNTHWDREWNHTFQRNRMALIDCLEKTMDLLENDPDYKFFHLDSQTVPLEDCMSMRPDMRERLLRHTQAGTIQVGPWYTLPEMNLLEGESVVRNLLLGHRVGKDWGGVMKIGYNPMSNGQISQLPQIYTGFGMDTIIFYRGINIETAPVEFWWESGDGSRALALQFPDGRGMFWSHAYLPVVYNVWGGMSETWPWKWGGPGAPCRVGDNTEYENLEPTDFYYEENLEKGLARGREWFLRHNPAKHLILMEGHDQCPPYPHVPRVVADFNRLYPDELMVHDSLPDAVAALREELPERPTLRGEMRATNQSGVPGYCFVHPGVLSARLYLKQHNRRNENQLFRQAEPGATVAWLLGREYPKPFLDEALRMLLANHAHDDICGCSIDKVHSDMLFRNSEIESLTGEIVNRSLQSLLSRIDLDDQDEQALFIAAFNSLPYARNQEVTELLVDIPDSLAASHGMNNTDLGLTLLDEQGQPVPCQIEAAAEVGCHINQDAITRALPVQRFRVQTMISVPGIGYRSLKVKPVSRQTGEDQAFIYDRQANQLGNQFMEVSFNPNGTLDMLCKQSGRKFTQLHSFEDNGAAGNAWIPRQPRNDRTIDSLNCRAQFRELANGPLAASVEISLTMPLPTGLTPDMQSRMETTRDIRLTTVVTLRRNSRRLEFATCFDNQVESHRLRALFPSDVATETSLAETPFDVVSRKISLPEGSEQWVDPARPEHPQVNFCAVQDEHGGLALVNRGLTEYEVKDDLRRTIALTLVRGFWQGGVASVKRSRQPGFQCFGQQLCHYAIVPFAGGWENADLGREALLYNVPMIGGQCGRHAGDLPPAAGFFEVNSTALTFHALKQAEDGKSVIMRFANPTAERIRTSLRFFHDFARAELVDLQEEPLRELPIAGRQLELTVEAKKIVTLRLVPEENRPEAVGNLAGSFGQG